MIEESKTKFNTVAESADETASWFIVVDQQLGEASRMELPSRGTVKLGNGLDNDVVLRHGSVEGNQIALHLNYPKLHIEVLQGCVQIGDESYHAGQKAPLNEESLNLGDVQVQLDGIEHEAAVPEIDPVPIALDVEHTDSADDDKQLDTNLRKQPYKIALVACSMFLVMIGTWQTVQSRSVKTPDMKIVVQAYLEQNELNAVDVTDTGDNIMLTGRIDRQNQLLEIERFVSRQSTPIGVDVVVTETAITQVVDYFRVNGVNASATFDSDGVMQVKTATDEEKIDTLKLAIAQELPQLQNWEIENTPPEQPTDIKQDPGKRVAMVVSDEPAYIVTKDATRYFVGAILPTGHRIVKIADGRVSLLKQGVESELQF